MPGSTASCDALLFSTPGLRLFALPLGLGLDAPPLFLLAPSRGFGFFPLAPDLGLQSLAFGFRFLTLPLGLGFQPFAFF